MSGAFSPAQWAEELTRLALEDGIGTFILAADEVVRVRADMEEILARHSGRSVIELRADTDRDQVFAATAAREYGLIDSVLGARAG